MTALRLATPADLAAARACYARNAFDGAIEPADWTLLAEDEGAVVGVLRVTEEHGHHVLRGVILDAERRRRGLGTRMLRAAVAHVGRRTCWLICGPHLMDFYGRAGFRLAPDEAAPPHLGRRVARYRDTYGPQCLMRREAPAE